MNVTLLVFLCGVATPSLLCTVVPVPGSLDISALMEKSDVVASGTVQSIVSSEPEVITLNGVRVRRVLRKAEVLTWRIYKGVVKDKFTVSFYSYDNPSVIQPAIKAGQFALFFLHQGAPGNLSYSDDYFARFFISKLADPTTASSGAIEMLQADLIEGLADADHDQVGTNLELLLGIKNSIKSPHLIHRAVPLLHNRDTRIAALAYAVLFKQCAMQDISGLKSFLDSVPVEREGGVLELANNLCPSQLTDGQLQLLIEISGSKHRVIRNSAVNCLRQMNTRAAVPAMLARLDDPDPYIAFSALKYLSEVTGLQSEEYSPDLPTFLQNRDGLVQKWKSWSAATNNRR
ncbi:MAG TPA: HEAT repeat domain-containing protein [Terriglobales bacterium]|nr:HEAT repeat domain-containing protein [Terriglobales bacterium]